MIVQEMLDYCKSVLCILCLRNVWHQLLFVSHETLVWAKL